LVAETIHPACMCEGGGRGGQRGGRAFYYTYIYNGKRLSCEGAELVGVLVAETIHPACMCEGGGRGGEEGGRAFYCVCLLLQDLVQNCLRGGGGGILEDMLGPVRNPVL
jgi:hypothetical protein